MAQKVYVRLIDDLDGGEAVETVAFSLDGTSYEIDLSSENVSRLRKQLAPYVDHARTASSGGGVHRRRQTRAGRGRERSSEIRSWARGRGYKLSERGRIPAHIIEGYEASESQRQAHEMVIDVYLDTDDEVVAARVFAAVEHLVRIIGIDEMAPGEVLHGSIFKRFKATVPAVLSEESIQLRLQTVERAIELRQVDSRQSEVDLRTSEAVTRIFNSLENVPQACIRCGSLLIVKYQDTSGPVLLCRQLSQPEILAFERYPELQSHPKEIFDSLALAMSHKNELIEDGPEENV